MAVSLAIAGPFRQHRFVLKMIAYLKCKKMYENWLLFQHMVFQFKQHHIVLNVLFYFVKAIEKHNFDIQIRFS